MWRLTSGKIYRVKPRSAEQPEDIANGVPFIPNAAQRRFLDSPHNRAVILKSRQLGYSTLIDLMLFDYACWNAERNCIIVAHTEVAAYELMRNRIMYAYERLPEPLKLSMPLKKKSEGQIIFEHNNSSIRVTTSARSDAVHFLHVSEMGKIVAKFPERAQEVVSGSIQAVTPDGRCYVESTAEGASGTFYDMCEDARRVTEIARNEDADLNQMEYRFIFSGWLDDPTAYHPDPAVVRYTDTDLDMFETMEKAVGHVIPLTQRAWYVTKRNREFNSDPHLMLREYPTTPDEAFRSSTEGRFYAAALAYAHSQNRICDLPVLDHVPVNAMFDLGASDFTTCWLHQKSGAWDHFIDYHEEAGTGMLPFVRWLERHESVLGRLYLPHDALALQKGIDNPTSLFTMLRNLKPQWDWVVVPRTPSILGGINLVRAEFAQYRFDATKCSTGLRHLQDYRRVWSVQTQCFTDEPLHDEASHCADALRQLAQARAFGLEVENVKRHQRRKRRVTGMSA